MLKHLAWALLLVFSPLARAQAPEKPLTINICTPEWALYTEKDGKGLYHDLWRKVFPPANVQIKVWYTPFKRCETSLKQDPDSPYDAVAAAYASDQVVVPKWHIGKDLISVIYLKGTLEQWTGQEQLTGKRVAWQRGYEFDKYGVITADIIKVEFNRLKEGLNMLNRGRVDFVIGYRNTTREVIKKLALTDRLTMAADVISGPKYYLVFRDNEKGRRLAAIWDQRMEKLHASGELKTLYQQYEDQAY